MSYSLSLTLLLKQDKTGVTDHQNVCSKKHTEFLSTQWLLWRRSHKRNKPQYDSNSDVFLFTSDVHKKWSFPFSHILITLGSLTLKENVWLKFWSSSLNIQNNVIRLQKNIYTDALVKKPQKAFSWRKIILKVWSPSVQYASSLQLQIK
jgi:hypothetical protein